jgi:hypothetical protein
MIKIYKDVAANAIFIEDPNGAQFMNTLQATVDVVDTVSVTDQAKGFEILTAIPHTDIADENGTPYPGTAVQVCDALNALFALSGTSSGELPSITSSTAIALVEGETLNYELTADYGVGYEWDLSNVSGVTTVDGNIRKLVGGSALSTGTYNIPVKAINYNGEDSETIVLTVSTPPFADTKSIQFNNQDYLGANAALLDATLGRASNGAGASDAWSISFWFKGGTHTSNGQTILYFGDNDITNSGHFHLRYRGGTNALRVSYGSSNNKVQWNSANDVLPSNTWKHVLVTYDGGTTGASSGSLSNYYSRFTVFVDGTDITSGGTWTHNNYGYSGGVDADNFRVGRYASGNYLQSNCKLDELAIWNSDQSSNVSSIYNSGSTFDLTALGTSPTHWWRMGDGDTYPTLHDQVGTAHFVMYNMTVADIVSDVP